MTNENISQMSCPARCIPTTHRIPQLRYQSQWCYCRTLRHPDNLHDCQNLRYRWPRTLITRTWHSASRDAGQLVAQHRMHCTTLSEPCRRHSPLLGRTDHHILATTHPADCTCQRRSARNLRPHCKPTPREMSLCEHRQTLSRLNTLPDRLSRLNTLSHNRKK